MPFISQEREEAAQFVDLSVRLAGCLSGCLLSLLQCTAYWKNEQRPSNRNHSHPSAVIREAAARFLFTGGLDRCQWLLNPDCGHRSTRMRCYFLQCYTCVSGLCLEMGSVSTVHSGWLQKMPHGHTFSKCKRRWFALRTKDDKYWLEYFNDNNSTKPKGECSVISHDFLRDFSSQNSFRAHSLRAHTFSEINRELHS